MDSLREETRKFSPFFTRRKSKKYKAGVISNFFQRSTDFPIGWKEVSKNFRKRSCKFKQKIKFFHCGASPS